MINVRVVGMLQEEEEKKFALLALPPLPPRNEKRRKNMTGNRNPMSITPNYRSSHAMESSTITPTPTDIDRIINKPCRMKFSSLSPPPPQFQQCETYTTHSLISFPKRRRTGNKTFLTIAANNKSRASPPSSLLCPFTIPSLASTAPILIPLLLLHIVTVPGTVLKSYFLSFFLL